MIRLETRRYKTPQGRIRGRTSLLNKGYDYFEYHQGSRGLALTYGRLHGQLPQDMEVPDAMKPMERTIEHAIMSGDPRYCERCKKAIAKRVVRFAYAKDVSEKTGKTLWMRFSMKVCLPCSHRIMEHEEMMGRL